MSADSLPTLPGGKAPAGAFFSVWYPGAEKMEKVTESIKLHLPERMKRDVQDAAMTDDRKVSDWIRHVLAQYLYGMKGSRELDNYNGAMCPGEGGVDG